MSEIPTSSVRSVQHRGKPFRGESLTEGTEGKEAPWLRGRDAREGPEVLRLAAGDVEGAVDRVDREADEAADEVEKGADRAGDKAGRGVDELKK